MNKIYEMLEEIKPEHNFKESENFVEDGMVDSFDIISLVSMLEEEYGIVVDGLDVLPENFATVDAIAELVKKSGGQVE